jgi:hypothetical protein
MRTTNTDTHKNQSWISKIILLKKETIRSSEPKPKIGGIEINQLRNYFKIWFQFCIVTFEGNLPSWILIIRQHCAKLQCNALCLNYAWKKVLFTEHEGINTSYVSLSQTLAFGVNYPRLTIKNVNVDIMMRWSCVAYTVCRYSGRYTIFVSINLRFIHVN